MGPVLAGLGVVALVVGFLDLLWTTLAASGGGGPLTARVSASLRRAGLPTVGDDEFHARLEDGARRRSALIAFVRDDGWE